MRSVWAVVLLPRNIVVALLRSYRAVISPLYGDVCRYYPTCSAYGLAAVRCHGVVRGALLTAWRICRCNPWSSGGVDDVPGVSGGRYAVTEHGWVVRTVERPITTDISTSTPSLTERINCVWIP